MLKNVYFTELAVLRCIRLSVGMYWSVLILRVVWKERKAIRWHLVNVWKICNDKCCRSYIIFDIFPHCRRTESRECAFIMRKYRADDKREWNYLSIRWISSGKGVNISWKKVVEFQKTETHCVWKSIGFWFEWIFHFTWFHYSFYQLFFWRGFVVMVNTDGVPQHAFCRHPPLKEKKVPINAA